MIKRVLITGAYGFIGRYVAREYKRNKYYVVGIGHGKWGRDEFFSWGIDEWYEDDILLEVLRLYAKEPEIIVHCAGSGSVGFSIEYPMLDFERTVKTMQIVLEYIRLYSPNSKLIYPSSAAVYGNAYNLPIKVDSMLRPISPYGVHKKFAEELCKLYCSQYGVSAIIIRLFSVYGEGLKKQLLWDACNKARGTQALFWGTGKETRDWVHVIDVANLLYMAQFYANDCCECEIVNCGSGKSISIEETVNILFNALKERKEKIFFNGKEDTGNPRNYLADLTEINKWGWRPKVKLTKGIEMYAEWYRKNKEN